MTLPASTVTSLSRGIPRDLDGTLCTCPSPSARGRPHAPSYVLVHRLERSVGCTSAAAAFAAQHRLPFPLTSGTPPERP